MTANKMQKLNVAVLMGGQSSEHEISLISAFNVISAIDPEKYSVIAIGISRKGEWSLQDPRKPVLNENNPKTVELAPGGKRVVFKPGEGKESFKVEGGESLKIDCFFPILHGPKGEDGTIQGMLKLTGIPFVGCDVLSSAACMDKDITKKLLSQAGIANADYLVAETDGPDLHFPEAESKLGTPMFIKPANQGSSIGVFKVKNEEEFENGMKQAFKFDTKLVVERGIAGREIECSVLGNSRPVASLPGEVVLSDEFYSFETKYVSEDGAKLQIPAELSSEQLSSMQKLALKAYKALQCSGLARVDFFLTEDGNWMINEINTLPGFTSISMYPQMWEASGISYSELIDQLIELALTRFEVMSQLKSSV